MTDSPHPGMSRPLAARLDARLSLLARKDRLRALHPPHGIDLCSNDYLGFADHPAIRTSIQTALEQGVPHGSTASRLLRGHTLWHGAIEARLKRFTKSEAALIFNSGYDANVGLIATLCRAGDWILADERIHASMIDGARMSKAARHSFLHNDPDSLAHLLAKVPAGKTVFVLVESLYSMDGDRAPLKAIADLCRNHQAHLIVDEAHATGVFGAHGAGLLEETGLGGQVLARVHTFGKALGCFGAFVACPQKVRDYLVNHCRTLMYTTALPPLLLAQWAAALDLLQRESWRRIRVLELAARFRDAMVGRVAMGRSDSQIVPLIVGDDRRALELARAYASKGFDIRAIRPPTVPRGQARLRVSFSASLNDETIARLIQVSHTLFPLAPKTTTRIENP